MSDSKLDVPGWYVIRTHLKQEDRAESNLRALNIRTFAPKYMKRRYNEFTGRPSDQKSPLFPRYIFAFFELKALLHKVRFTRGVHSVLSFGEVPTAVDDEIIETIQSRVEADGFVKIDEAFKPGDPVKVKDGALQSLTGIFERAMKDSERVMVLLNTVNYQIHYEVSRAMVCAAAA